MKKIHDYFSGKGFPLVLAVAFITLTAQIGYRYVRGSGTAGSVSCWSSSYRQDDCTAAEISADVFPLATDTRIAEDDVEIRLGDADDFSLEWLDSSSAARIEIPNGGQVAVADPTITIFAILSNNDLFQFIPDGTTANGYFQINDLPEAAASGSALDYSGTVGVMDGSDTVSIIDIGITNANHTGSGNTLRGIVFDNITGDAEASEYAIQIGTGWDRDIYASDGFTVEAVNGATFVLGASNSFLINDGSGVDWSFLAGDGAQMDAGAQITVEGTAQNIDTTSNFQRVFGDADGNEDTIATITAPGSGASAMVITLVCDNNEITFVDGGDGGAAASLRLNGGNFACNEDDTLTLVYFGTMPDGNAQWVEVTRSTSTQKALRNDFTAPVYIMAEEDLSTAVPTDAAENLIIFPTEQIWSFGFRPEQAFAGNATAIFDTAGYMDISNMVDNVDTDGIDFRLGSSHVAGTGYNTQHSFLYDEDNSTSAYCEISIKITTIANIDEFYFGWRLDNPSYFDANDVTTSDTAAYFRVPDNAGDLDIETELNGGGTNNDDTGVTWADGEEKVLRVTMSADSVSFTLDGAAVTQTNAVLNADNGDQMTCFWGFQNSAVGATAGVLINYVEYAVSQ